MNTKEIQIQALLTPTVKALDCEIWGVELMSQGRHSMLRVYIDRPEGISVEDCERVSRHAGDVLDVEEVLTQGYTLEVSSPGMDRILFNADQYAASVGEQVEVRLNYPFEGRKRIVGLLVGIESDDAYGQVVVQVDDEQYLLPLENVQRARIVPQFD
jgi:ribosome maturation factor RimP